MPAPNSPKAQELHWVGASNQDIDGTGHKLLGSVDKFKFVTANVDGSDVVIHLWKVNNDDVTELDSERLAGQTIERWDNNDTGLAILLTYDISKWHITHITCTGSVLNISMSSGFDIWGIEFGDSVGYVREMLVAGDSSEVCIFSESLGGLQHFAGYSFSGTNTWGFTLPEWSTSALVGMPTSNRILINNYTPLERSFSTYPIANNSWTGGPTYVMSNTYNVTDPGYPINLVETFAYVYADTSFGFPAPGSTGAFSTDWGQSGADADLGSTYLDEGGFIIKVVMQDSGTSFTFGVDLDIDFTVDNVDWATVRLADSTVVFHLDLSSIYPGANNVQLLNGSGSVLDSISAPVVSTSPWAHADGKTVYFAAGTGGIVYYRALDATGDTLSWATAQGTVVTNWPNDTPPVVGVWEGQIAMAPGGVGGGES